jgi:hypothetical protein
MIFFKTYIYILAFVLVYIFYLIYLYIYIFFNVRIVQNAKQQLSLPVVLFFFFVLFALSFVYGMLLTSYE